MTTLRGFYAYELNRPARISLLLMLVLSISLADLALTLWSRHTPHFYEANPLARSLLYAESLWPILLFKLGFTGLAIIIFWLLRQNPIAELGLWSIASVYFILAIHWSNITPMMMH